MKISRVVGATALLALRLAGGVVYRDVPWGIAEVRGERRLAGGAVYGDVPLAFEPNLGQAGPEVRFLARGRDLTVLLTSDGALIRRGTSLVRMRLEGADPNSAPRGRGVQAGQAHYFIGPPENWHTGIPLYTEVEYTDIYPGVTLVFYSVDGALEYDLRLAPGATPEMVRLSFEGMDSLELVDGDLILRTAEGELRHGKPLVRQDVDGRVVGIDAAYQLAGDHEARLAIAPFDRRRELVVDPALTYSTRAGGAGDDRAWAIAVDSSRCVYIAGETWPVRFPGTKVGSGAGANQEVFVTKLNSAGTGVVYSAYLGGRDRDVARGIAVDAAGAAYVTGFTYSQDFPTTAGAYQTTPAGMEDAFILKLAPSGASLVYSSLLGGAGSDLATGIALDAAGEAYVAGHTSSRAFPVTAGAVQRTFGGGAYDAFVARLNAAGTALDWATYLGGSGTDLAKAVAVDAAGFAYVAGSTASTNLPMANPYKGTLSGAQDAFVAKLRPSGDTLSFATYLGGSGADSVSGISVDASGAAYVAGSTYSGDFPVTAGAFQTVNRGGYDAFVTKLTSAGSALVYSTYLGGGGSEEAAAIAVDSAGRASVAGYTQSANFPVQEAAQAALAGTRDAFVTILNETGTALNQSTYLGGANDDQATAVAVPAAGETYVTGLTLSADFPTTTSAWRTAPIGSADAFVAKLGAPNLPPSAVSVTPSSGSGTGQTFSFVASDGNGATDIEAVMVIVNGALGTANGCVVYHDRAANTVTLASDNGATWLPTVTLGAAAALENSQCILGASGSSATVSGATLTLNLQLSFKPAFSGLRRIYAIARDHSQTYSGWQELGSWTVPG